MSTSKLFVEDFKFVAGRSFDSQRRLVRIMFDLIHMKNLERSLVMLVINDTYFHLNIVDERWWKRAMYSRNKLIVFKILSAFNLIFFSYSFTNDDDDEILSAFNLISNICKRGLREPKLADGEILNCMLVAKRKLTA